MSKRAQRSPEDIKTARKQQRGNGVAGPTHQVISDVGGIPSAEAFGFARVSVNLDERLRLSPKSLGQAPKGAVVAKVQLRGVATKRLPVEKRDGLVMLRKTGIGPVARAISKSYASVLRALEAY